MTDKKEIKSGVKSLEDESHELDVVGKHFLNAVRSFNNGYKKFLRRYFKILADPKKHKKMSFNKARNMMAEVFELERQADIIARLAQPYIKHTFFSLMSMEKESRDLREGFFATLQTQDLDKAMRDEMVLFSMAENFIEKEHKQLGITKRQVNQIARDIMALRDVAREKIVPKDWFKESGTSYREELKRAKDFRRAFEKAVEGFEKGYARWVKKYYGRLAGGGWNSMKKQAKVISEMRDVEREAFFVSDYMRRYATDLIKCFDVIGRWIAPVYERYSQDVSFKWKSKDQLLKEQEQLIDRLREDIDEDVIEFTDIELASMLRDWNKRMKRWKKLRDQGARLKAA